MDWKVPFPNTSLDAAGLIALADLNTIAYRTVLSGSANFLDALVLCPGIHRQQKASDLNKGKFPAAAALTTGYIFRIENQATVAYLQTVGTTGQLQSLVIEKARGRGTWHTFWMGFFGPVESTISALFYLAATLSTVGVITLYLFLKIGGALLFC